MGLLVLVITQFDATGASLPVEISNRTPLDTGDFSLTIKIDRDTIFLTGKFFPKTTGGERIVGNVLLGISFQDKAGTVLAESTAAVRQGDLGYGYSAPIGRAAPAPGGVDVSVLARVVLTVRELTTQEALDRERKRQQQAALAAEEARTRDAHEAEAKREREQKEQRQAEARREREREEQRQAAIRARAWPKHIEAAAIERKVLPGMTTEQVALAWGQPQRVNQTLRASGLSKQWVYSISTYVYFENGRVTAVQSSR